MRTQAERRKYLIRYLLQENPRGKEIRVPAAETEQKALLRGLMNIRPAGSADPEFLKVQDDYLHRALEEKGITDSETLQPIEHGICLWQGDITTLACDAIVNAANSGMTGCYYPCHGCIDNAIHTYAGVQLRQECAEMMARFGCPEKTGGAKITRAYNLPCKYVLHTVGPIVSGQPGQNDEKLLACCYRSCLSLAQEKNLHSVAFCCISTGEFHFPNHRAAEIAIQTVRVFLQETNADMRVIFNVFKDTDYAIYKKLLG